MSKTGTRCQARRDSRKQHIFNFHHAARRANLSPEKFIGMHFMNPVPMMALVEVIRGLATSDDTFQTTMQLCEKLDKNPSP